MVGLIGIVGKGDIDIKKLSYDMCQVIRHENYHNVDIYVDTGYDNKIALGRVHTSILNPESQPIFNEDETICIMMDGEIYDYDNIKNDLVLKGYKFLINNEPELVLHLYEEYGEDFVHKLNGIFSIVIWNSNLHKLSIVNDRYGLRPIYYTHNNGYLLFASEIKAILQDNTFKRIVDDRSVEEFFCLGYILGNKTLFREIELLPPASIMTFIDEDGKEKENQISIKQYWDFNFNIGKTKYSEDHYIENMSKFITQAIMRQIKGNYSKIGVLLSGGLDSRTIIGTIDKICDTNNMSTEIHTYTYGKSSCNDAKFAQIISKELGTVHHFYEFRPEDIVESIEKVIYITDGMLNIFNLPIMQTYNDIAKFTDIIFHGWIGDATNGGYLDLKFLISDKEDDFEIFKLLCNVLPVDIGELFSKDYIPIIEKNLDISKEYVSELGKSIDSPYDKLIYYNLRERQRRFISVGFIYMRNSLESRTPFSDYDYVDFSLSIPSKLKVNKHIYKKMILRAFHKLEDIPYSSTGLPIYKTNFQSKKLVNFVTRKIFGYKLFPDDEKKTIADYGKWLRTNKILIDYVIKILLDKKTLERPYFNQEAIKSILDLHMNGKKDYTSLIGLLLTFELWNRQFIDMK